MAIAFGAGLGTAITHDTTAGITNLTTTAAVSSGGLIVVGFGLYKNGTVTGLTISGGGLTWTTDLFATPGTDANYVVGIATAYAPSGLASASTLTPALVGGGDAFAIQLDAFYFTGTATTSWRDGSGVSASSTGGNSTVNITTGTANDVVVGFAWVDATSSATGTPQNSFTGVPSTAVQNSGDATTFQALYKIVTTATTYTVADTFSAGTPYNIGAIAIKPAGGTDASVTVPAVDGVGDIPNPTVTATANQTVTVPPIDGTGDVPTPTVTASANATVTVPPVDGTGDVPNPAVSAGSNAQVTAPPLDGVGDIGNPAVSASSTVTVGPIDGTGDLVAPAQVISAQVTSGPLSGTGDVPTPAVTGTGDATVISAKLDGTGDVPNPVVTGTADAHVTAPPLDAAGDIAAPTVHGGATITVPALDAAGDIPTPSATSGGPRTRLGEVDTGGVVVTARRTGGVVATSVTGGTSTTSLTGGTAATSLTGGRQLELV